MKCNEQQINVYYRHLSLKHSSFYPPRLRRSISINCFAVRNRTQSSGRVPTDGALRTKGDIRTFIFLFTSLLLVVALTYLVSFLYFVYRTSFWGRFREFLLHVSFVNRHLQFIISFECFKDV